MARNCFYDNEAYGQVDFQGFFYYFFGGLVKI